MSAACVFSFVGVLDWGGGTLAHLIPVLVQERQRD